LVNLYRYASVRELGDCAKADSAGLSQERVDSIMSVVKNEETSLRAGEVGRRTLCTLLTHLLLV
jgi:hypothetical protein